MSKRIRLNAATVNGPTVSPGLWRHPEEQAARYRDLSYWIDYARLLERGRFDGLFFADMLGAYDVYRGSPAPALAEGIQIPLNDPRYLIPAMAAATEHLGFAVTVSTTYELPYPVARQFSTLDHLTGGRVGWNIVTSNLESAARAYGLSGEIPVAERYARGEDFITAAYKLWETSWQDDALLIDKESRLYAYPARVHDVHHDGPYFKVDGLHLVDPSPQRTPFLFQAGSSEIGRQFAARHAEAVFLNTPTAQATKFIIDDVRNRAEKEGRDPASILFFPKMTPIIAETDALADARYRDFLSYSSMSGIFTLLGAWTSLDFDAVGEDKLLAIAEKADQRGLLESLRRNEPGRHWSPEDLSAVFAFGTSALTIGGPETVADWMEEYIEFTGADGFNVAAVIQPGTVESFIDHVVPVLQKRGRVQTDYAAGTLREKYAGSGPHLPADHVGRRIAEAATHDHAPEVVPA
jgi:FMN-dependent oxidoreductase (nitrilotriacetate monooxygenase family)